MKILLVQFRLVRLNILQHAQLSKKLGQIRDQVVSNWFLKAEIRVHLHVYPCRIYGKQSCIDTVYSSSMYFLSC
jgi:hypothetical protein